MAGSYITSIIGLILASFGITIHINFNEFINFTNNGLGLIYMGLIGPVLEELTFRGVILNRLKRYGTKFSIITSAVIFFIAHVNLGQLLQSFLMGLILGYIFVRTNSLFLPVILHIMMNSFSIICGALTRNIGSEFLIFSLILITFFLGTIYILYSSKGNISLGKNLDLIGEVKKLNKLGNRVEGDINIKNEFSQNIFITFYSTFPIALMMLVYLYLLMSSIKVV